MKAEKIHSKIDIYFKETCQELKIKIDPNDYANIYQDILLISKLEESTMRYNINKYMMIYIINPNISLSKIITLNNISPILFLTEYLIWLRDPKF
ncbi:TPA: hypothetical protein DEG21_04530 [Patescibacteria group bacterium]|nr:hypothetical protein [Candidatus Gracilibacteria bacterium]HBY75102.1 hypothetical protein [Candidatus Gracilibacteria bacterium]